MEVLQPKIVATNIVVLSTVLDTLWGQSPKFSKRVINVAFFLDNNDADFLQSSLKPQFERPECFRTPKIRGGLKEMTFPLIHWPYILLGHPPSGN